jgi:hypothetical protein
MQEPTGFPTRDDSTLSFTDGTLTFTIDPASPQFSYYISGKKYTKNSQSKIISDVEGVHYLYFDGDTLEETTVFDINLLYEKALVAVVYWDATNAKHIYLGDERHGLTMDGQTHAHFHLTRGTAWISGLALDGILADEAGDLDTHAQCGYTAGLIRDEDLPFTPSADAAPAQIPVFYKEGATPVWRRYDATDFPVRQYQANPANRLSYNQYNVGGAVWQETEVANGDFVLSHIFVTNDLAQPVIAIQGESDYVTLPAARAGAPAEISTISTAGLPFVEFTPIGTIIFQTGNAGGTNYTNAVHARTISTALGADYIDFRQFTLASTGSVSSHSNLSNLGNDDHLQYLAMLRAGDITGLTNEAAPLPADVLLMERVSDGLKRKVPVSSVDLPKDYQRVESIAESTTDLGTPQTKVQLVTGALTGTYRIGYGAKVKNNDKGGQAILYNVTDAVIIPSATSIHQFRVSNMADNYWSISGVFEIVLVGVSKTIELQYYDDGGGETQYIKDAFIEFWKVGN